MPRSSRARRAGLAVAGALVVAIALTGCAADPTVAVDVPAQTEGALPDETQQQLQAAVERAMVSTGSTGAIVGVWAPWSGSWVSGLGVVAPGGAAVDTDMQFRAGNVTRAMTCDVLDAVDAAGTVSRDDSVTKWVNGLSGYEDVTLGQLCDSTSGIASFAPYLTPSWLNTPSRVWNPKELVAYGLGAPATGAPGAGFSASDTGYVLLGLALERATGTSAADLIAKHVTAPLTLEETSLPPATQDLATAGVPVLTGLHSSVGADGVMNCAAPADLTALSSSAGFTAGGVVTDITDLGRYAQALASSSLPSADADRFADPLAAVGDGPAWFTAAGGTYQAGSLIGQYGGTLGYITAAFADPTTGMAVAVVLNNSGGTADVSAYLAWELAAIASKAPAASGQTAPEAGLPWTAEQYDQQIASLAICAPPTE